MKNWNKPELQELNLNSTEYYALTGTTVDGEYTSYDGTYHKYTYSGTGTPVLPYGN